MEKPIFKDKWITIRVVDTVEMIVQYLIKLCKKHLNLYRGTLYDNLFIFNFYHIRN